MPGPRSRQILPLALAAALAVAASADPALAKPSGQARPKPARATAKLPFPQGGVLIVKRGDTVLRVARRYRMAPARIVALNRLRPPFRLKPGQRLLLPPPDHHIAGQGDTVYAIARRYGVLIRKLIEANRLAAPYGLRVGQRLSLPPPRTHRVRPGDTVYNIGRRYSVARSQLVRLNRIVPPYTIKVGTILRLPARVNAGSGSVAADAARKNEKPRPAQRPPVKKRNVAAANEMAGRRGPVRRARGIRKAAARPVWKFRLPARTRGRFQWPVRGRTISRFGRKKGGLRNDGINVAARRGAPVVAAESGVVAYSGSRLRGFGNLILIRHPSGWVTAYAHTQRVLVQRGQRVTRGQPIATVGATGTVGTPQLHFEIRRRGRPVNPLKHL